MYQNIALKAIENPHIREKLIATGSKKLHEATRSDTFGIAAGLTAER